MDRGKQSLFAVRQAERNGIYPDCRGEKRRTDVNTDLKLYKDEKTF